MTTIAAMCENSCTVGDGVAIAALALGGAAVAIAFVWGLLR